MLTGDEDASKNRIPSHLLKHTCSNWNQNYSDISHVFIRLSNLNTPDASFLLDLFFVHYVHAR